MPKRNSIRDQRVRLSIASEAARIIATEGQRSYLLAKQKAAERLGASPRTSLPSNAQVEAELKNWQQLYGGAEHEQQLRQLRLAARSAMQRFAAFGPRLVGPVLEGTADRFSRVSMHLFADDPDAVVHFLMQERIDFGQERRRLRWHDGDYRHVDVLLIESNAATIELILMIGRDALQPPPSPITGQPLRRASLAELDKLINQSSDDPSAPAWH